MSFFARIKDKYRQWKQHPVGKVLLNKYFIVGLFFLIYICFIDTNNVGQMIRSRVTLRNQRQQMEFYEREITKMDRKLEQLKKEYASVESDRSKLYDSMVSDVEKIVLRISGEKGVNAVFLTYVSNVSAVDLTESVADALKKEKK